MLVCRDSHGHDLCSFISYWLFSDQAEFIFCFEGLCLPSSKCCVLYGIYYIIPRSLSFFLLIIKCHHDEISNYYFDSHHFCILLLNHSPSWISQVKLGKILTVLFRRHNLYITEFLNASLLIMNK